MITICKCKLRHSQKIGRYKAMLTSRKVERPSLPIFVMCPSFDENSGGIIVLHVLVDRMRMLGVEAYAVPYIKDYSDVRSRWLRAIKTWNGLRKHRNFKSHPSMDVPVASGECVGDGIIVYPETVSGNPLGARRVVRWLLNRPGFFGVDARIGADDEIFFYQETFAQGIEGISPSRLLQVRWLRDDIYRDLGRERSGSCRMIRKGTATAAQIPTPDDAIPLDGKSHAEIAEIFNTTEVFYCHDLYTMYAYYAVLCGCIPVVVPQPGLSSEDWHAGFELKNGVAYGEEEMDWARSTRKQLIADMRQAKERELENVMHFLAILKERFG